MSLFVYKEHLVEILHDPEPLGFLVVEKHEVVVSVYSMFIHLIPVVLFEIHGVLFKDNLDLSLIGDFKYNQARELGAYGF